jgi:hypothetical protein
MVILKFIQWVVGLIVMLYVLKGMLGKFRDGDLTKGVIIAAIWLGLAVVTTGFISINFK